MRSLFRAELLRSVSGRMLAGTLLTAIALNVLAIVGAGSTKLDAVRAGQLSTAAVSHDLVRLGFGALLFSSLFGATLTTREFRHGSIARSFTAAGTPERLIGAKLAAVLPSAVAFGLAGAFSALAGSFAVVTAAGYHLVMDRESVLILVGVFAACALAGPWGSLLGWILRSQLGAVAAIMVWTLIAEPAIAAVDPSLGRFLPGGAEASIYRDANGHVLPVAWGYVVFTAWLLMAAAASILLTRRRDIA